MVFASGSPPRGPVLVPRQQMTLPPGTLFANPLPGGEGVGKPGDRETPLSPPEMGLPPAGLGSSLTPCRWGHPRAGVGLSAGG